MIVLLALKVKGALFLGIVAAAAGAFITGVASLPDSIVSMPPSISGIFMKFDLSGALSWGFIGSSNRFRDGFC